MARARAIETRLEKLLPALDEYFTSGFLTRDETLDVSRQRTHWEYRLVAKPLLLLDVQGAIKYELGLEDRLRKYCSTSHVKLKHRWSILERIETVYKIGLKNLRQASEKELLRGECVLFLKHFKRESSLSRLYGELMITFPTRSDIWVEAAMWEGIERNNIDNGRAIVQQALLTMAKETALWNCAMHMELHFVSRLMDGIVADHREEQLKLKEKAAQNGQPVVEEAAEEGHLASKLRSEDEGMSHLLLDVALVRAVVEEALDSVAGGPALVQELLRTASKFAFAKEVVVCLVEGAVKKMLSVLSDEDTSKRTRTIWLEGGLDKLLGEWLLLPHLLQNRFRVPLCDATTYLNHGCISPKEDPEARRTAAIQALSSVLAFADAPDTRKKKVTFGRTVDNVLCSSAVRVLSELATFSPEGVSGVCRTLLDVNGTRSVSQLVSLLFGKKKLNKQQLENLVSGPQARVENLLQLAEETAGELPSAKTRRRTDPSGEDKFRWSAPELAQFLKPEHREVLSTFGSSARQSVVEDIERLMLWWHAERAVSTQDEKARVSSVAARKEAVASLLRRHALLRPSRTDASTDKNGLGAVLEVKRALVFVDSKSTPVALWKLFNALELLRDYTGLALSPAGEQPSSQDLSSDDDDEADACVVRRRAFPSYAAAGLHFLSSIPQALLDRQDELERVVGICALLRSRIYTQTGLKQVTRSALLHCMKASSCSPPAWVKDVHETVALCRKCQPLPRYCQAAIMIPFLEAVAMYEHDPAAFKEAEATHENVLNLYSHTEHANGSVVVLYDGIERQASKLKASAETVRALNTDDWIAYIAFEREVAQDLIKAKMAVGRARLAALTPQLLFSRLNC